MNVENKQGFGNSTEIQLEVIICVFVEFMQDCGRFKNVHDFTVANARRFYLSMGKLLVNKGLINYLPTLY